MQCTFLKSNLLLIVVTFFSMTNLAAQGTIQTQFDEFYSTETSNWQEYRLIKKPKLKEFWSLVSDTLKVKEVKIISARAEVVVLNGELAKVHETLQSTELELEESISHNESISFLGIQMKKGAYSTMVWLIILGLVAVVVMLYLLYLRNSRVTKEARENLFNLEHEYTAHKEQARTNQTKLKRELQTAQNLLQENRIKF